MAPGYPSLFLPKYVLSNMYNPTKLKCSPSHATRINRLNRMLQEKDNQPVMNGKTIQSASLTKIDVTVQHTCRCACGKEFNDSGQKPKMFTINEAETEAERFKELNTKGKGKKSQKFLNDAPAEDSREKNKCTSIQNIARTEPETTGKEDTTSSNSQDTAKSEESGIFDENIKTELESGQKIEPRRIEDTSISRDQKITDYIRKSCQNKTDNSDSEQRNIVKCSQKSYTVEVDSETTDVSSYHSTDNDLDLDNTNKRAHRKSKSSRRKHKRGSRREKKTEEHSKKDDSKHLVMNAEDIE